MSTYSATIQLSNGTLTVTRPHPAVEAVDGVVDDLLFRVRDEDSPVTSIGVTVVTNDTASSTPEPPTVDSPVDTGTPSDTPIGDAIPASAG